MTTKPICEIQWIDDDSRPTPDSSVAIGTVQMIEHVVQINGRGVVIPASRLYCICADHAKKLSEPNMHNWRFTPLTEEAKS